MGITGNLMKAWVSCRYGKPFGQILGVTTPRHGASLPVNVTIEEMLISALALKRDAVCDGDI